MDDEISNRHRRRLAPATRIAHGGRAEGSDGFINPPVVRASTVLYPTVEATRTRKQRYTYGIHGTPTTDALAEVVSDLEGADHTILAPSGLAACTLVLGTFAKAGAHVVVTDNVYGPTRNFCTGTLARLGIETRFVDPMDPSAVEAALPGASALFLEVPGSLTFEVPDTRHLAAMGRAAGAVTILDNTWATPLFFRPLEHGCDLSVHAATKYLGGHSDLLVGTVSGSGEAIEKVAAERRLWGLNVGADDVYLTLRGIRTLAARLEVHQRSARMVAEWLSAHPRVHRVLYPALPDAAGHEQWKRDFDGATGLFSITFKGPSDAAVCKFVDGLELFGIGYSWGGYESLATAQPVQRTRSATSWPQDEHVVRLSIGMEDPADLIADLDQALRGMET